MDVAAALKELSELQQKDLELDRIREEIERVPPELSELKAVWDEKIEALMDLKDRLRRVQREYEQNDLELKDLAAKKARAEEEQLGATSSREATQYENRIQQLSTRIDELTELTMPLIEEIERLEGEIQALEAELAELKPKLEALEKENAERVAALEAEYAKKQAEREKLAKGVPQTVLREYEVVRRARKGIGIARMIKVKESFRCEACRVQLPTHVAQKVYQGRQVVRCPSCGRILYRE